MSNLRLSDVRLILTGLPVLCSRYDDVPDSVYIKLTSTAPKAPASRDEVIERAHLHAAAREPVLLVRAPGSSGAAAPAFEVSLLDDAAAVVAQVVYRPAQPLPCGAQVWLESHLELTFHDRAGAPCLPVTFKDLKHKESSHG